MNSDGDYRLRCCRSSSVCTVVLKYGPREKTGRFSVIENSGKNLLGIFFCPLYTRRALYYCKILFLLNNM